MLILWGAVIEHGFSGQSWLTFRQALGARRQCPQGRARHDRRLCRPLHSGRRTAARGETGEEAQAIPFLKRFTVFNTDQCEGLPEEIADRRAAAAEAGLIQPQVEALIAATGVDFRIGGERAFYVPTHDFVQVPPPQAYFEPINWHRTALHELRSLQRRTPHRLNRDLSGSFGSKAMRRGAGRRDDRRLLSAPRSASCRPCAMPTISAPGWRCCARTTAPSSAPPAPASKAADFCSPSCPSDGDVRRRHRRPTNRRRRDALPPLRDAGMPRSRVYGFCVRGDRRARGRLRFS